MVVFGQSGCILTKELCSGKLVLFGQKWLYSGKSASFRAKNVVFGQKWLLSGKSGCIRARIAVFGQKWFYSGKSGCIRAKWCYSGKVVVFGQNFVLV